MIDPFEATAIIGVLENDLQEDERHIANHKAELRGKRKTVEKVRKLLRPGVTQRQDEEELS
jgi:hypothetical protein